MKTVVVSLFAGIGGFDLAARWMGWESLVICEIDPMCQQVLGHHFPEAYLHGDIKTLTGEVINHEIEKRLGPDWRAATRLVLVGGFPCQPYSSAGKRLGSEDGRYLWPETIRVVGECRPDAIVLENVPGLGSILHPAMYAEMEASAVDAIRRKNFGPFHEWKKRQKVEIQFKVVQQRILAGILQDIEETGYCLPKGIDGSPVVLSVPAASVGAPHERDRLWIVANAGCSAGGRGWKGNQHGVRQRHGHRQPQREEAPDKPEGQTQERRTPENPDSNGWVGRKRQEEPEIGKLRDACAGGDERLRPHNGETGAVPDPYSINGDNAGFRPGEVCLQEQAGVFRQPPRPDPKGVGGQGDPSPWKQEPQSQGGARLSGRDDAGGYWDEWPTVPPIHSGDDGVPDRLDHSRLLTGMKGKPREPYVAYNRLNKFGLKASGNAVVPQVVFQVFKALEASW